MDLDDLRPWAAKIESIGRNCEWGMVQGEWGAHPISLLRWAGSERRELLAAAFRDRFSELGTTMSGRGDPPWNPPEEQFYWLTDETYKIIFHTPDKVAGTTLERAVERNRPRLRRLAENLMEKIEDPTACFLYSDADLRGPDEAAELVESFRSAGRGRLLLVLADERKAGTAEDLGNRVTAGWVQRLTLPGQANTFDVRSWPEMLRAANAIEAI